MKPRLTIFLSGVSHEFGSFRDAVENEVQKKGCFAENQSSFAPDYRTVEEMLRRKLHDADAVFHIVGFRFGAEPNERPADKPRRSYTQMEFDIAREMQKPVYVFLSADATVRDPAKPEEKPEEPEVTALQLAHRQAVQGTNKLYYPFTSATDLRQLVAAIPMVAQAGEFKVDITRIDRYAPGEKLNDAWAKVRKAESARPHILTFVALGGEGKTSLLAKWAADLAYQNWPGCDAAFAWSFYSQDTREQTAASSDLFLKEALTFFGDPAMAGSAQGAFDKGRRLAQLVGERRALLILDGLEPLQYAPTSPTPGELKDPGIAALLKGLAATNHGLCVVTTRYSIPDLRAYWQNTAPETKLLRLSKEAGVALLKSLGVKGTQQEFERLVEDAKGHALTLNLLGTYLHGAHAGDIRKRDLVKLEEANPEVQGGHAFRVMDAYVRWFESEGEKGKRALAVLRLLGLFDRPATGDCLTALQEAPAIPNLTEVLVGMTEAQRNIELKRLEEAKLLTVNRDAAGILLSLDAHPLLREYFARQVRTQHPAAWRGAHRRLYEHLCATTPDKHKPTLEELQPLYQAVVHGCQAEMQQEAFERVSNARVAQEDKSYSTWILGAYSADLGTVACFFEQPWSRLSAALTPNAQDFLLNHAGNCLRALGRLTEALEPTQASMRMSEKLKNRRNAAVSASVLNALMLTLGDVATAVMDAERYMAEADAKGNLFERMSNRVPLANALLHSGRWADGKQRFGEAEEIQRAIWPQARFLYSLQGFQYCDLLLASTERAAWTAMLFGAGHSRLDRDETGTLSELQDVAKRAEQTLDWAVVNHLDFGPLAIALDHLTLGRVALYAAILDFPDPHLRTAISRITAAMDGLRGAHEQDHIARGLLTRAWARFLEGNAAGAQADLNEAWEIAERGPMRLHMADIHLYRARLFHAVTPYPWEGRPRADLAAARALIEKHGYWRRKEELEDAEAAAEKW